MRMIRARAGPPDEEAKRRLFHFVEAHRIAAPVIELRYTLGSKGSGLAAEPKAPLFPRDCREFRVWVGHIGMKENPYGPTQRASDT
jgi:hypothetical protein